MRDTAFNLLVVGQLDPFVLATQRTRCGGLAAADIRSVNDAIVEFVRTGIFSSKEFAGVVMSDGSNLPRMAERLARYNYHVASLSNPDDDLMADVAFTLYQLLMSLPDSLQERERLLEESYEVIRARRLPAAVQFHVCYMAAKTYTELSRFDEKHLTSLIRTASDALNCSREASLDRPAELVELHYWLGLALSQGEENLAQIRRSVQHLKACVSDREHCTGRLRGSAMNSLGYSLTLLGDLIGDVDAIREAIDVLERALPHRLGPKDTALTKGNLTAARKALAGHSVSSCSPTAAELIERRISAATEAFESALTEQLQGREREARMKSGMNHLLEVARSLRSDDATAELRAHFYLAIGIGLVFNGDSAGAVCMLRAAARRWDTLGVLPRQAASYYNLGLAFGTMQGLRSEDAYAGQAIASFRQARERFKEMGLSERVDVCNRFIEGLERKQP